MPIPNLPAPNNQMSAYERGTQKILIDSATGTVTQSGKAAPAAAQIIGVPPIIARGTIPSNWAVQIDVGGTGSFSALTVNLLGSLDGVNFYVVATFNAATGGLNFVSLEPMRYISASITTATVASGTPTATVSISG